jgi:hypothetical protein
LEEARRDLVPRSAVGSEVVARRWSAAGRKRVVARRWTSAAAVGSEAIRITVLKIAGAMSSGSLFAANVRSRSEYANMNALSNRTSRIRARVAW